MSRSIFRLPLPIYIYISHSASSHCLLFVHLPARSVCMSHSTPCMSCSTICLYASQYSLSLRLIFKSLGAVCQCISQYFRYNYLYVSRRCFSIRLTVLSHAATIYMSLGAVCLYVSQLALSCHNYLYVSRRYLYVCLTILSLRLSICLTALSVCTYVS